MQIMKKFLRAKQYVEKIDPGLQIQRVAPDDEVAVLLMATFPQDVAEELVKTVGFDVDMEAEQFYVQMNNGQVRKVIVTPFADCFRPNGQFYLEWFSPAQAGHWKHEGVLLWNKETNLYSRVSR